MRERERALELAANGSQEPATAVLPIAVAPVADEVPTRTAILPTIPQPEAHTAESYSDLLSSLLLPPREPAPLASAEDFMHAAAPAAFAAPADSAEAPVLRRSRRAADVDFDAIVPGAPVADPGPRRGARTRGPVEALGASELSAGGLDTPPADALDDELGDDDTTVGTLSVESLTADSLSVDALFAEALAAGSLAGESVPSGSARSAQADDLAPRRRSSAGGRPGPRASSAPSAPRATARSITRRVATKTTVVLAMGFVALMAVATSVPAEALLTADDVKAAALIAKMPSKSEPGQSVIASGADSITVQADDYETATIAEAAAASGIRMEATFVNNPNGAVQWPFAVGVHVGDRFGYRDCAGCSSNHGGQDFNPGLGAEIQSIADGVVTLAEDGEGSLGVHMMIEHQINGETITSVYAHMQHGTMRYSAGDVVKVGDVIGNTGTTGMSTGPHLHFEIRLGGINGTKTDPLDWLYANTN
ncbi:peptidoglycan DD-metalloendopeptidase family protein [Microterricola pindariensis]|uniref:M23ase beta-sheet core domain-containing protein n=1 Tax=Microterricola pindariensis TaxID=478010 RepID=A0ABX5AUY7_9MICO|nr:peptidoglycan DD-metalloendopeptidase family protein [Microterricola pindariensis]PPL16611.1 hypothetical protein GY24_12450 [Microterricola pindariensis]